LNVPVIAHQGPLVAGTRMRFSHLVDRRIADQETLTLGPYTLRAHYTPGHCADGVCYEVLDNPIVAVGDVVFPAGPGRTTNAQEFQTTLDTLRRVVLAWSDDKVLYPGHGGPCRLGDIRARIERFVARDHGAFFGDASW
jgi:hydroxyacylglutathione hydrolase